MKLISKTLNKVTLLTSLQEIKKRGFDNVWDDVRRVYSKNDYKIEKIEIDNENGIITMFLKRKIITYDFD